MNFKEARNLIRKGKKVRRYSWKNKDFHLPNEDEGNVPYLDFSDIDADDWTIYKPSKKKKICSRCKQEIK